MRSKNSSLRIILNLTLTILLTSSSLLAQTQPLSASEIQQKLSHLGKVASVLYIAAHPDDENTRFIAKIASEKGYRTGYLSLTRGSGGQNLIGPEKGDALGVVRSSELLEARKIDGAYQMFTSAIDFGYSKSAEDSLKVWNEQKLLEDVVWAIRIFRPDVIVTRFEPNTKGHGHHKASAVLAEKAFEKAADSSFAKEQLKFAPTWQAKRLVHNKPTWYKEKKKDNRKKVSLDVSGYNSLSGKTSSEIAAASRSMHKSQGFGTAAKLGEVAEEFVLIAGQPFKDSIMEGVETSFSRFKGLSTAEDSLARIKRTFNPKAPWRSIRPLLNLKSTLVVIQDASWRLYLNNSIDSLIQSALGLRLYLDSETKKVSPDSSIKTTLSVINHSPVPLKIGEIGMLEQRKKTSLTTKNGSLAQSSYTFKLPNDLDYSLPFWLRQEKVGAHYQLDRATSHLPRLSSNLTAEVSVNLLGETLLLKVPLEFQTVSPVDGARRDETAVVPIISARFPKALHIQTRSKEYLEIAIELHAAKLTKAISGHIKLQVPSQWSVTTNPLPFSLREGSEHTNLVFRVKAENFNSVAPQEVSAIILSEGKAPTNALQVKEIEYRHIPRTTIVSRATSLLLALDVSPRPFKVAYIDGTGDGVASVLEELGMTVERLTSLGRLDNFETVILGIRALNKKPWLLDAKQTFNDFVKDGGNLVVQYNTNNRLAPLNDPIGPFPFTISRDRVVEESALVNILDDQHQLLNVPNSITDLDFDNWIQERGLYFADSWSSEYQTPLAMHDTGEKDLRGSLLYAKHGKGRFIYTGLSFFRQLPAGVPGAIKLFLNIVDQGQSKNDE